MAKTKVDPAAKTSAAKTNVARRGFLKGAAASAAALVAQPQLASAQQQGGRGGGGRGGNATAPTPSDAALAAENGQRLQGYAARVVEKPGSDFMVDVLKTLDLEYLASNPGSTFDSLHESLINYGNNKMPEFLTCTHEESAVAMAHGYSKMEGKPMMALIHGTVGLQHASMAIYNCYCDRVPIYLVVGNHEDAAVRAGGVESYHSAQDMAAMVRDIVKWDDEPQSLQHFAESAVRAYKFGTTPPMGPTLIVCNHELQSKPLTETNLRIPKMTPTAPPTGDPAAVAETAKLLVNAENPMIIAQRCARTPEGMKLVTELAELLQAPVNSSERMNIPMRHPLTGGGLQGMQPDVTLALEVNDISGNARQSRQRGSKLISISSVNLFMKSNMQDFGRYGDADIDMGADGQATLPQLIEACRKLITPDRKRFFEDRGKKLADAHKQQRLRAMEQAGVGWDASPISTARLSAELWPFIKDEDWSLLTWTGFVSGWPDRLWNFDKWHRSIGSGGGGGVGGGLPTTIGAALANKKHGRLSIAIQGDGDLNFAPGVLWTAAHHRIPILTIVHNNRGYHAEVMLVEQQCSLHNRGADKAHIGTKLWDPEINYSKMAEAYGIYGQGPITDAKDLPGAYKRAIERVKKGEPALIDVVSQPR